jgi:hypothetical protein
MKIRKSFFIRWLKTFDSDKNELSVIDVEHVQSGETWRLSSIDEIAETIKKVDDSDPSSGQELNTLL